MPALAKSPAHWPLLGWLGRLVERPRSRKSGYSHPRIRRAALERALALSQMPEYLRRDLGVDGGARMAQPERRSGWPLW